MGERQYKSEIRAHLAFKKKGKWFERSISPLLTVLASISVLTTIGIVFTLLKEAYHFFQETSVWDFITGIEWTPFFASDPKYGIWALVSGTFTITVIAILFAAPIGLAIAIYLSEYASDKVRRILKPILEILAGIPTIVYGYFALTFVTPLLQEVFPELSRFNALSPGLVLGVMIIPSIASLSEDAMTAVPQAIRQGAYALGATRLEAAIQVVLPAALSGIVASMVLAVSRAIGETMIVTVAGGSSPNFGFHPMESVQTMTAYIVQVSTGDAGYGSTLYYSIYAVGFMLFLFTFVMNIFSRYISRKFREEY